MRRIAPLVLLLCPFLSLHGQHWSELLLDPAVDLGTVQQALHPLEDSLAAVRGKGYKAFKRMEWFLEPRLHPDGRAVDPAVLQEAWQQAQAMRRPNGDRAAAWQPLGLTAWSTTSYNPGNGRVNTVAVDPTDPQKIYVGTPMGGVWRSSDGGNSWAPLLTNQPSLGISGIAIDPTAPNTIYVATGDGDGRHTYGLGVIKSTDGGLTWNTTGLNWVTRQVRTTRRLLMHPSNSQTLFCAASNGLWRTTDGGANWTLVSSGAFHDVEFKPGDPSVVYACTKNFLRSTDGGATFTLVNTGLPTSGNVNRLRIAVTDQSPSMVYVLAGRSDDDGYRGLYRSTDSGQNFTLRSNSPNLFGYQQNGSDSGGQSWFDMALAVDPADAQQVYVGGINVWKSTDGGSNWTIKSHWIYPSAVGYTHADIHDLAFFNGTLYCGSDGGIYTSTNGGDSWTDRSGGLDITQFYRLGGSELDPGQVIAGCIDNGSNLLNGGVWTHVQGADGMEAIVDHSDPQVLYCTMQNGMLYRSLDGGASFNGISASISETGNWVTPFVMNPTNAQQLLAGYDNVWRSNDRGNTWNMVSGFGGGGGKLRALAVAPSDGTTIYVSNLSIIRRSYTGMSPWTNITAGLPQQAITSIAVHPFNRDIVYVTLSGYRQGDKVYVSTNGGGSWTNITRNLPNAPANTVVFESGSSGGLYVGTDVGVFYTDSTLSGWQHFSDGLPSAVVNELEINYTSGQLRAATFGRGIWWTPLYQPSGLPPVAAFTTTGTDLCAGAPVQFHDASSEAAPSWSWSFPGGTPSSSTASNPNVVYPSTGVYTASLTVSNAYGSDTYSLPVEVYYNAEGVDIAITLDNYPQESSWSITNQTTGAVVANGGPYTGRPQGSSLTAQACLPGGCYIFTMHDAYGDGMCCSQGTGSYSATGLDGTVYATGASFTFEESTVFCLSGNVGAPPHHVDARPWFVAPLDGEGQFLLRAPDGDGSMWRLSIHDALGRAIQQRELVRTADARLVIDLRSVSSGAYRMVLTTEGERWTSNLVR
ncbi:MAG: PKD domain-containing protein [Flavobacteriales bacterium]|nr:PKD domain-containing protein [Flavobacteriales bacterium]